MLGDPDHPISRGKLCQKCALAYNGVWRDPEARLQRPLRRRGSKASGSFEPISWDDALAEIAAQLERAIESHGPESIFHAHYTGTCSLLAGEFPMRFFHRLGATDVEPDTICNNAGHEALGYVLGTSVDGFDPKTIADSRCVMVWGANPSASAPHAHSHWLRETSATVIAVDPVRHASAEQADIHLQPFPGSDAALAFGMMHVIRREGLIDEGFVSAHTVGWEEIEPLIEASTPRRTEELTGVPVATMEEAARHYATGPSLLWLGQGLQRQPQGGNVMRACAVLPAVTGNLGKPGAGVCYLNGDGPRNIDSDYVGAAQLKRAPTPDDQPHGSRRRTRRPRARARLLLLEHERRRFRAASTRFAQGALARGSLHGRHRSISDRHRGFRGHRVAGRELSRIRRHHDALLSPLCIRTGEGRGPARRSAAEPRKSFAGSLARWGYQEPELYEGDRAILDIILDRTGLGFGFDELAERGTIDPFPDPVIRFADGKFPTPSGRVEIASARAEADGHPRVPQPGADARPADGQLRLLSPASEWLMNDSYGNDPNVLSKLGPACIYLNPEDAKALALNEGRDGDRLQPDG